MFVNGDRLRAVRFLAKFVYSFRYFYFVSNYFHAAAQAARLGYHHNIFSPNYIVNKSNTPADTVSRVNSLLLFQHCCDIFWKIIKTM